MTKRIDVINESGIRKIFTKAADVKNAFDLSIGQPDFEVPIKGSLIKAINDNKTKYTPSQGISELINKIKDKYNTGEVIITTGASGGLFLTYSALLDVDDELIIFDPYFVSYPNLAKFLGIKPVIVNTNNDFSINFKLLEQSITSKTKAIMLNSPNNPTGYVISKKELIKIIEIANKNNLWIISDEIYSDFDYENKFCSINSLYDKAIVVSGFAKNMAMTGLRLGYIVTPKSLYDDMVKLQQYTFVCAPSICQYAVSENFNIDISEKINEFKKRRDYVYDKLNPHFEIIKPNGAFYYYIKCPNGINASEFANKCVEQKLLIVPSTPFSIKDDYFRVSYAVKQDVLEKSLDVLISVKQSLTN
jgi:aspartate/methionine/tyrosine aminotransferase